MKKQELLEALLLVKSGLNVSGVSASMGYFYFNKTDVTTYNNVICITSPIKTGLKGFVRGNELLNLLLKLKSNDIEIKLKDSKIVITTQKVKASLNLIEDSEFISNIKAIKKSMKNIKWKKLPDDFCDCIKASSSIYLKEESDSLFSNALISGNTCVSTDNQRIVKTTMKSSMDKVMIKCSEIDKLVNIEPIKYSVGKRWVNFKNEKGVIFSIRKIMGNFPDISGMFDFKGFKIKLPPELTDGIDVATIFVDSFTPFIFIKISKDKCILSIKSPYGEIKHKTKIKYSGSPLTFAINPEFLKSMIKHSTVFILKKDKTQIRIESKNYSLLSVLYKED